MNLTLPKLKEIFWRSLFKKFLFIRSWYLDKYVIPAYSQKREIILYYKAKYNSKTLVETGTFFGDTIQALKNHFDFLFSIELSKELAEKAQKRFDDFDKIKIIHGDSGKVLSEIIDNLNQPILFWLDGHFSSSFYVGDQFIQTAKGDSNTPILDELLVILKSGIQKNVILIDDARCFVGKNDYPSLHDLKTFLGRFDISNNQISINKDIIRITPA